MQQGVRSQMIQSGGEAAVEWSCNVCKAVWKSRYLPDDWTKAFIDYSAVQT